MPAPGGGVSARALRGVSHLLRVIAERTGILCDIRSWHVTALAGQRDSTRKKRDMVAARERVLSRRRERRLPRAYRDGATLAA